ncbi:HEAT repeat domain-containing protein [Kitasatospora atroaurantiaca]|uniref:HEAT repeat domain-containing protein n=1 Tax=Kitasatospora atroaurantiaca TaxID=285545 RepID=UPI0011A0276E|nr:HEAT repeat domain-containing protein [Kitasatospora atroaurantiaca]
MKHNYGSAADVPALLRTIAGPNAGEALEACDDLGNLLHHQGGWVCSAATAALPFLLALAADPTVSQRVGLVELATWLAETATTAQPRFVDDGWPAAWEQRRPVVLSLLADSDPAMRRAAIDLLARGGGPIRANLSCLLERWQHEEDRPTRLELLLALGAVAGQSKPDAQDVQTLLDDLLTDAQPSFRPAAVHAWGSLDPTAPARNLDLMLDVLTSPSAPAELESAWAGHNVGQVIARTYKLLAHDPASATEFVSRLAAPPADADVRRAALAQAGSLLSQWRSPTPSLLPLLAQSLEDPHPEVRLEAAHLLAALGRDAAPNADELAARLNDTGTGTRRSGTTVGDNALWGLTRLHDPRCLPGLVERLYATQKVFATHGSGYPRDSFYYPTLPGIHEVLIPLREYADVLLPSIRELMKHAVAVDDWEANRAFAQVLEAWGEAALPALPDLIPLLADQRIWQAAATALAAIGPGAADATSALQRCTEHATPNEQQTVAWAAWRIGGDPQPALELLGGAMTDDTVFHDTIRRLGELGPLAAPYADRLRHLVANSSSWTQAEAAIALWSVTGDTETTVPALEGILRPLADGRYLTVMLRAVRHLTRIGKLTTTAEAALRQALVFDGRLASSGSWRTFAEDKDIREAIRELLATARTNTARP